MRTDTAIETIRPRVLSEPMLLWTSLMCMAMRQMGAHVDAWYHIHYGFAIESFFTWPHALLYAGWLGGGLVVAVYLFDSIRLDAPRRVWLPPGYALVVLGTVLFGLGGLFDLIWHSLVGFEVRLETLLAPSHLWLVFSSMVTIFGLLQASVGYRASQQASGYRPVLADVPVVLCLSFLLRGTLWSLFYSEPSAADYAAAAGSGHLLPPLAGIGLALAAQVAGTTGILLHSALVALYLAASLRHLRLPGGAIAAALLWDALLVAGTTELWRYLPAAVGAALVGEAIWAWVWRGGLGGLEREAGYWAVASVVPMVQFFLYFALMEAFGGGVLWTTHLWAGAPVLAGFFGLIAGVLAVPPRLLQPPHSA